jgi:CubicO group peptidase (beta-lactamase class C family)
MVNQEKAQALLDKQINTGHIYNAVVGVLSRDGGQEVIAAAGLADVASGAPMLPDTPVALASITKLYTAAVIMKLHQQRRLDLDEAMAAYLPAALIDRIHVHNGTDYSRQIRVYQLLSQTTGLPDYFEDRPKGGQSVFDRLKQGEDFGLNMEQVAEMARQMSPHFPPGAASETKARYCDTNFRLLGAIIEAVTGQPVPQVFEQMIFAPLGLASTWLYDAALLHTRPAPATIYLKGDAVHLPQFLSSNQTDGGIVATTRDTLVFLRAFFEGQLFDKSLFSRMTQRWNRIFFPMQYGYGMMRIKMPRIFSPFQPLPEFIGHSGSTGSFAYYCPDKALYLAGTVNQIAAPGRAVRLMMRLAMQPA